MSKRLKHFFSSMESHPVLGRFAHRFAEAALWRFDRNTVSRAVAIGLFFGIMTPVAQIVFAAVAAIVLRANLPVSVASTLITNPFTFPLIYYLAFRIGLFLTGPSPELIADLAVSEEAATHALEVENWFSILVGWVTSVGPPLIIGLLTLAISLSVTGYLIVFSSWAWISRFRAWRRRRATLRRRASGL